MDERVTARFVLVAGALVRGQMLTQLKTFCFQQGLDVEVEESRGWLESVYRVKVSGPLLAVRVLCTVLQRWVRDAEMER